MWYARQACRVTSVRQGFSLRLSIDTTPLHRLGGGGAWLRGAVGVRVPGASPFRIRSKPRPARATVAPNEQREQNVPLKTIVWTIRPLTTGRFDPVKASETRPRSQTYTVPSVRTSTSYYKIVQVHQILQPQSRSCVFSVTYQTIDLFQIIPTTISSRFSSMFVNCFQSVEMYDSDRFLARFGR